MEGWSQNDKILLGLKVRLLRQEKGLSFGEFAHRTGLSISYLNEIEKGKKFPRKDKIIIIAKGLQVPPATLLTPSVPKALIPVETLLKSNFLNELPLELFGIEQTKVVELIAKAPSRVGAFISTLIEISKNYALNEGNFYFGALRSYLEMHNNYFEDLEEEVLAFRRRFINEKIEFSADLLKGLLEKEYGYAIVEKGLDKFRELQNLRAVFVPKERCLFLNSSMTNQQKLFQFGKELGFNFMKLKERANTSSLVRVRSFEEVLNHFKAGYFSAALLINREEFVIDLTRLFENKQWKSEEFLRLLDKYQSSPETLFQRMTNLLPLHFGMENLFFLRFIHWPKTGKYKIDKELNLNRSRLPHLTNHHEHYCRRWLSFTLLEDLKKRQWNGGGKELIADIQYATYRDTGDEYLCISLAKPAYPDDECNTSVTIGILADENLKEKIQFTGDENISRKIVGNTCERCNLKDCAERGAAPAILLEKEKYRTMLKALTNLTGE